MSQKKKPSKKIVVPTQSKITIPTNSKVKSRTISKNKAPQELLFGKQNYILIIGGAVLVALGLMLMIGGEQAPDVWNEDEIYSTRRIIIAPMVILAGLVVEIFAIFRKKEINPPSEAEA